MLFHIDCLMLALLFGWLACASAALSQQANKRGGTVYADSCLVASEFQLGPVALHADGENAVEHLGKWLRIRTDSGEDDGGPYEQQTYFYRDLEVEVVRGLVTRVATHSQAIETPSGLRPGLSRTEVRRVLFDKGVTFKETGDTLRIAACSPPGFVLEDVVVLAFDRRRRVRDVEMHTSSP